MGRSEASAQREARRARSARSLVGRRAGEGGCATGHPAFLDVRPAFELGRMKEGGGYPVGFIQLAARLMGCEDLGAVVHLCSGSVGARLTFDIRPEVRPAAVADVRWLPLRPGSVQWIMADPPYSAEYAEALWGTGKAYPTTAVLLREARDALRPGGRLALLHQVVPVLPAGLARIGTWGVTTGPGYRIRCLTVAELERTPRSLPGL